MSSNKTTIRFFKFTNKIKHTCVYAFVGHHVGTLHKTLSAESGDKKKVNLNVQFTLYYWGMLTENLLFNFKLKMLLNLSSNLRLKMLKEVTTLTFYYLFCWVFLFCPLK